MEKSALRSVAGTSRAGVGRREAGQALRRSAKNSLRDRLADHAAILDGRKYAAQSPFHRTGTKLHGAHGPAPHPARQTVKNLGKVQNVQAVQMVQGDFGKPSCGCSVGSPPNFLPPSTGED